MAKRSSRIPAGPSVELNCIWGLSSILQSCRGLESPKFISHWWPDRRHDTADHRRKFEQLPTSFDGECRKIRDEVEPARVSFNGSVGGARAHQLSSFSGLDDAASLTDPPSTSAEESWNELAFVHRDLRRDGSPYECSQTSDRLGKLDPVRLQQLQMSAKDLSDQMLIDGERTWKQHVAKREPKSLPSRRFKNAKPSGTEKERIKSMLDAKLSEYLSKEASVPQKPRCSSAVRKGNTDKHSWKKIDYWCSCSSETSSVSQPVPQNVNNFEYVTCSTSLFSLRKKLNRAFGSASIGCGVDPKRFSSSTAAVDTKGKVGKKQNLKSNRRSGFDSFTDAAGKNLEFDVILQATRHLSERLRKRNNVAAARNEQPLRTLSRILASPEHDFCVLSPGRYNQYCSETPTTISSDDNSCPSSSLDDRGEDDEKKSSPMITIDEKAHATDPGSELHKNADRVECSSMLDSLSEKASTDFQSIRSSDYQPNVTDSSKSQEHQSPVSVLEPYFIEDADSCQAARRTLQPLRLDFEERASELFSSDRSISVGSCLEEQDFLFEYVHLVMRASKFDWDQLSEIQSLPDELLPPSLFDEVEFLPTNCYFDPRLLFDHINEVLIQIHRSHFCSRSPLLPRKPKSTSLAELVLNEITRQAEFYLLPHTERRTLDQLVSGNAECCRSWIDLQPDSEQITADIADDFLEECIVDILLDSLT